MFWERVDSGIKLALIGCACSKRARIDARCRKQVQPTCAVLACFLKSDGFVLCYFIVSEILKVTFAMGQHR